MIKAHVYFAEAAQIVQCAAEFGECFIIWDIGKERSICDWFSLRLCAVELVANGQ
jgi:hypothetical protein